MRSISSSSPSEPQSNQTEAEETTILITHATDTVSETGEAREGIQGKIIVLTRALAPARFRGTDAVFNIGCATRAA